MNDTRTPAPYDPADGGAYVDPAPEVRWADRRPAACYRGTCNHRQHDGIANPRYVAPGTMPAVSLSPSGEKSAPMYQEATAGRRYRLTFENSTETVLCTNVALTDTGRSLSFITPYGQRFTLTEPAHTFTLAPLTDDPAEDRAGAVTGRVVGSGPGHIDLGNGAYSADVHLDLDYRDNGPDSDTVAELHLGLANHDPEVGEDVADVAAVCVELTIGDIDALIAYLGTMRDTIAKGN